MLRFESAELEKEVLSGESCIAVPIEIYAPMSGETIVTAYSFCKDAARRVLEQFGDDLLSDKALEYIDKEFKTIAENIGYRHDGHENQMMLEYEMHDLSQLNKKLIRGDCIKITSQDVLSKLCENSGCEIELEGDGDVMFAVVGDGRIMSYAGVNDYTDDVNSLEINVETAEDCRRCGYASAAVCALCEHILCSGKKAVYKCSAENTASSALAEKCGFELFGRRYSYVCYKYRQK